MQAALEETQAEEATPAEAVATVGVTTEMVVTAAVTVEASAEEGDVAVNVESRADDVVTAAEVVTVEAVAAVMEVIKMTHFIAI